MAAQQQHAINSSKTQTTGTSTSPSCHSLAGVNGLNAPLSSESQGSLLEGRVKLVDLNGASGLWCDGGGGTGDGGGLEGDVLVWS